MRSAIKTLEDLAWARENNPKLIEELLEEVTIMEDLENYLSWLDASETTTIITTELKRNKERSLGIHPSSACKKDVCLLKLYYECTGDLPSKRAYDPIMQRTWDIGTLLHDMYQAHFNNMYGDQFTDEVSLRHKKFHIKSHADGVFDFTRVRIVLEAKSIKEGGNFGWEKVQKKPMEDNVRQAYFYMKLSNCPFAIIFYANKNAGKLKEHPVVFDPEVWDEMVKDIVEPVVDTSYNKGPKIEGKPGFHCKWCNFNHSCPAARQERNYVKGANRPWGRR